MGKIIFVRHGETDLNRDNLIFGILDPSLNSLGIEQAKASSQKLLTLNYDIIYSSPLKRAVETAEIINHKNFDIEIDERLKELNFGKLEGLTIEEIKEKFPSCYEQMENDWKNCNYISGETPKEMYSRTIDFLKSLDYQKDNLVVAHWGTINCAISYLISGNIDSYWKFALKNGGIVVLEGDSNFMYLVNFNM